MRHTLPFWKAQWDLGKRQGPAGWGKGREERCLQKGWGRLATSDHTCVPP